MSRLPLHTLLKFMYRWSVQDKVSKAVKECGISKHVVVDWYSFLQGCVWAILFWTIL